MGFFCGLAGLLRGISQGQAVYLYYIEQYNDQQYIYIISNNIITSCILI